MSKDSLLQSAGKVVSPFRHDDSYDVSKPSSLIAIRIDEGYIRPQKNYPSDVDVFTINVIGNRFSNQKMVFPMGEKVVILYKDVKYGRNDKILLAYDIRSQNKVYFSYGDAVKNYKDIQSKSLYFFVLSMILYTIVTLFSINFVVNLSRSE